MCSLPAVVNAQTQGAAIATTPDTGVVLAKLSPPVYPPLARQARIMGDVKVQVLIREDGGIASAEVISGHPILKQAALDSARQSQFECRGCSEPTLFPMTYSFTVLDKVEPNPDPCCCTQRPNASAIPPGQNAPQPQVTQFQDHVTISVTAWQACMCPDACEIKWAEEHSRFRSAKCLYLWKCGVRHIAIE